MVSCNAGFLKNIQGTSCLDDGQPTCTLKMSSSSVVSGSSVTVTVTNGSHINAAGNNSITCNGSWGTTNGLQRILNPVNYRTSCSAFVINETGSKAGFCSSTVNISN